MTTLSEALAELQRLRLEFATAAENIEALLGFVISRRSTFWKEPGVVQQVTASYLRMAETQRAYIEAVDKTIIYGDPNLTIGVDPEAPEKDLDLSTIRLVVIDTNQATYVHLSEANRWLMQQVGPRRWVATAHNHRVQPNPETGVLQP
jgi:hypothetical protein